MKLFDAVEFADDFINQDGEVRAVVRTVLRDTHFNVRHFSTASLLTARTFLRKWKGLEGVEMALEWLEKNIETVSRERGWDRKESVLEL